MNTFSLYETATGLFTGNTVTCDDALIALNAPPAGFAWMQGEHNRYTRKVVGGAVVEQPPMLPAESDYLSWTWDAVQGAPRPVKKLKLLQEEAKPAVLEGLALLDGKVARPVGEIAQAQALGQTPPTAAVQRLQAVNADKQLLRSRLAAIEACTTADQLNALLAQPVALQTM